MTNLKTTLLATLLSFCLLASNAQSDIKSYSLKKGEVLDILLLSQKPETKELINEYFAKAFPIAQRMTYKGLGGFPVVESPMQGNYHPSSIIFGSWKDLNTRSKFLQDIDIEMPDFHEMRRQIWSNFDVIYYEMKQDLSFELDLKKYNVVTYYWEKDEKQFLKFRQEWVHKAKKAGGKVELELTGAMSPFGYVHNPDYLTITVWESKTSFDKFYKDNQGMDHSSVRQVNQFKIK